MTAIPAEMRAAYQAGLDGAYDHDTFAGQLLDGLGGLSRDTPEETTAALAGAAAALDELAGRVDEHGVDGDQLGVPPLAERHPGADPELRSAYQAGFRQQWGRARLLLAHGDTSAEEATVALRGVAQACLLAGRRLAGADG